MTRSLPTLNGDVLHVSLSESGWVVKAEINRPETKNAVNGELISALTTLLDWLEQQQDIRVFHLTGSGGAFISGGDLREFHQIRDTESAMEMGRSMTRVLSRIERLPFWTVASLDGIAYGGGWEVMLAFDFRISSSRSTFGFTQGTFYLPPGWGGLDRLTRTVGRDQALRLLASRAVLDVEEALRLGLIHEVYPQKHFEEMRGAFLKSLELNDREFIEFLKGSVDGVNSGTILKEDTGGENSETPHKGDASHPVSKDDEKLLRSFARFWIAPEHLRRVDEFLSRRKGR